MRLLIASLTALMFAATPAFADSAKKTNKPQSGKQTSQAGGTSSGKKVTKSNSGKTTSGTKTPTPK